MLTIERWVGLSPEQWEFVIGGMRNPKNSWDKSDSFSTYIEDNETLQVADFEFFMGDADHELASNLADGGPVHAKYRRMINVWMDIVAPLYWWKEFDTYKVGTVANSCSTMHKIHAKEFELDDFSHDHLGSENMRITISDQDYLLNTPTDCLIDIVDMLNAARNSYNTAARALKNRDLTNAERKHVKAQQKYYWWQMIQLLPSSYNQKRTVCLNYEVLANIYKWRRNHKLDEWHTFCDWIEQLPYSELITGIEKEEAENE